MSEFKFNCPSCNQHLMGDVRYAGLKINCPACGKQVLVPGAPAAPALAAPPAAPSLPPVPIAPPPPPRAASLSAPAAPRAPMPMPPGARPAAQRTSGLAIASLCCSIATFLGIPFAFVAGIICGHMAKKRIATTPGLGGAGLAKAGLIIGYIALSIYVLVVVAVVAFFGLVGARMKQLSTSQTGNPPFQQTTPMRRTGPMRGGQAPIRSSQAAVEAETTDTQPDGSGWTMDLSGVAIPSSPVSGRIHGQPFKLEKASIPGGWLKLAQGKDFFEDLGMEVVTFESDLAKLSGRTFTVQRGGSGMNPHIYMKWKEGANGRNQRSFTDRYVMQLEFGQSSRGKLPGKIYLCVPDKEKSFVAGTFELDLKGN